MKCDPYSELFHTIVEKAEKTPEKSDEENIFTII